MCLLLPLPSKVKLNDQWWRIVIGFPFMFVAIQFLCMSIIFVYETPKGSLLKSDEAQCRKMLGCIYRSRERVEKEVDNIDKVLNETVLRRLSGRREKKSAAANCSVLCFVAA